MSADDIVISAVVEGDIDQAVIQRLIQHSGAVLGPVYGKNGKQALRRNINGYNNAARYSPWVILVDLNHEADCAPILKQQWLGNPGQFLCFRVAVREIESWLLADQENLSKFLRLSRQRIPSNPEAVVNPKEVMVNLARRSRLRAIREDMVPRPGGGRIVGPAYSSRLIEFVTGQHDPWRPEIASQVSDSLNRCLRCLGSIIQLWKNKISNSAERPSD